MENLIFIIRKNNIGDEDEEERSYRQPVQGPA